MKKSVLIVSTLVLSTLLFAVAGRGDDPASQRTDLSSTVVEPGLSVDPNQIMSLLTESRPESALAILESNPDAENDPLALVLKSRAMRATVSDEDVKKSLIKDDVVDIHLVLDRAIELCNTAMEDPDSEPVYQYYRGRAWLGKTQLYTLTRSLWSAARSARRAKQDLQEYVERVPDDGNGLGDLGAFLYFADTLPGILKFMSKILFLPSGNREQGLEMLERAAASDAFFAVDYKIIIAAIYLVFEGRFEEGTDAMIALVNENPYYARLVEPFGVVGLMYPQRIRELQSVEDRSIQKHLERASESVDWSLVERIQLHRGYSGVFFGTPTRAFAEISLIAADPPERPDWVCPVSLLNRGYLLGRIGRTDEARHDLGRVLASESMKYFHDPAQDLLKSLEKPWETLRLDELDWVGLIYDRRIEEADTALRNFGRHHGRNETYFFYLGELKLFAQDFEAAARAYRATIDVEAFGGNQAYQMFAALRLAEIEGHQTRYKEAKKYIEQAIEYTPCSYVFEMLIRSRKRYYEMLEKGVLTTPPSMLQQSVADRSESMKAARQREVD